MKRVRWPHELHIVIASGILLAILVLLYLIAGRHNQRIDLTRDKVHSVSRETVQILDRMAGERIMVRAFFSDEDPASREFKILLKEMATHHPKFRYKFHDPDHSPSQARRYRIDSYRTSVVEYRGREERIQDFTEEALANALVRLAHPEKRILCFTTGHGEAGLSDEERVGLSEWKKTLGEHQYEVKEVQVLAPQGIPADCSAVVMAGPHYELLPREIEILKKYFESGRGLMLLIDPMDPGTGTSFERLVKPYGLKLGEDVVVDKMSRVFGGDFLVPLVSQYADHPITKQFRAVTFLPVARSVRRLADVPKGIEVTELAQTMPGSWAETDLKRLEDGNAELDPEKDLVGPVPLAACVERVPASKGGRLVVVGDSDFLTNAHLRLSGNKDFSLNMLQWLGRDDRWISIRPRISRFEPLFLRRNQSVGAAVFAIGVFPLTALVAGSTGIWLRRKRST